MQVAYPRAMDEIRRPYRIYREKWLIHLVERTGGPKVFAGLIESPDTHITALAKGRRNIGDDLADKIESTFRIPHGAMDIAPPGEPAKAGFQEPPSIEAALEALGAALAAAGDLTIVQVRPLLATLVDDPTRAAEIVPLLTHLLSQQRKPVPAVETGDFAGKPKSQAAKTAPANSSAGDFVKR